MNIPGSTDWRFVFLHSRCVGLAGLGVAGLGVASLLLTGCAGFRDGTAVTGPIGATTAAAQGSVHGGQQPIAGATVQLVAPGVTGYGSAGTVLVSTTSDSNGNFVLPQPYTCPTGNVLTYLVATGGNAGAGVNNAIGEAAVLGPCSGLTASTYISVSEVTTVAAAYALAPFASVSGAATNVGTSATNLLGLKNAAGPAGNLADTTMGGARGATSVSGMVLPTTTVNTLADILAACVNSGTAGVASSTCSALFLAATPPGGAAPSNTFQAAIDVALNPGNNAAALYALATPSAPYQPTLTTAPGDFALAIQYTGGQIAGSSFTSGLAIDAAGNAWVGNSAGNNPKSISEISPAGVFLSGPNGYANGIAGGNGFSIDASGNVFANVAALNEILKLNSSGAIVSQFTPASLVKPTGIAVDNRTGMIWSADSNNQPVISGQSNFIGTTVSGVTATGADAVGSPYGGENAPFGVEIDGLGNTWVANIGASTASPSNSGFVTKYSVPSTAGAAYGVQNFSTGTNSQPVEVGFDSANNAYVTLLNSVAKFSNAGVLLGSLIAAPTNYPTTVMVDGLGRVFVSNNTTPDFSTPGSLTVFSSTGTLVSTANGSKGYLAGNTLPYEPFAPTGLAIDPSGNVWMSGINNSGTVTYQFVTELVGMAAPVVTPTTVASSTNKYGQLP